MWSPTLSMRSMRSDADETAHRQFGALSLLSSCGDFGRTSPTRDDDGYILNTAYTSFDDDRHEPEPEPEYLSNVQSTMAETRDGAYPHVARVSPSAVMANTEERDFDAKPTELFAAIHARKWKKAAVWLKNEPEQAAVWVYRLENEDDDELSTQPDPENLPMRWRTLPLHAAVIFRAPLKLIHSLIEVNPQAAAHRDDRGMLPVHLALKTGAPKGTVRALFDAYPEGVDERDDENLLPLDLAKNSTSPYRKAYLNAWASTFYHLHNECDFDTNPTDLHTYLHKRDWEATIDITQADAATWVSRREVSTDAGSGELRWRMLPIHAAILFQAPDGIVQQVLRVNPAAAQCADDRGMLPIHVALAKRSSEPIINALLRAFPESMNIPDARGNLPIEIARSSKSELRDAYIDALERPIGFYTMNDECDFDTNPTNLYLAIEDGNWDVAEHLAYNAPQEVRTWVCKRDDKNNKKKKGKSQDANENINGKPSEGGDDKMKWRMLPLHAALLFSAPTQTIRFLCQAYPDACSCKSFPEHMLPIHIAIKNGLSVEIVEVLLMYYSDCLIDTDCKGRTVYTLTEACTNGLKDGYMGALDRGPMYWKRLLGAQEQGEYQSVGEEEYEIPPSSALPSANAGRDSPDGGHDGGGWQEGAEQQLLAPIEMNARAQSNVRAARGTDEDGFPLTPPHAITGPATGASAAVALAAANYIHQQQTQQQRKQQEEEQQQQQQQHEVMQDYYNSDPQQGSHGGDSSDEAAFPGKQAEGISQVISRSLSNLSPRKKRSDSKFIGRELVAVPIRGDGQPINASMVKTRPSSPPPQLRSSAAHGDAGAKKAANPVKRLGKKVGKVIARASSRQKGRQDNKNQVIQSSPTYSDQRNNSTTMVNQGGYSPRAAMASNPNMAFPEQPAQLAGLNPVGVVVEGADGEAAPKEEQQQSRQPQLQPHQEKQGAGNGAANGGGMRPVATRNRVVAPSTIDIDKQPDDIQNVVSDLTDPYKPGTPKPILKPQRLGLGGANTSPPTDDVHEEGQLLTHQNSNNSNELQPSPTEESAPKLVSPGSLLARQEERQDMNIVPVPTHRLVMKSGLKGGKGKTAAKAAGAVGTAAALKMRSRSISPTSARSAKTPAAVKTNLGTINNEASNYVTGIARGRNDANSNVSGNGNRQRSSSVLRSGLKNNKKTRKDKRRNNVPTEISLTSDQETTFVRGSGKYSSMMTGDDALQVETNITGNPSNVSRDTLQDVQHTMQLLGQNTETNHVSVTNTDLISRIGQGGGRQTSDLNADRDGASLEKNRSAESVESTITDSTRTGQRKSMILEQVVDEVVDSMGEAIFDNQFVHGLSSMLGQKGKAKAKQQRKDTKNKSDDETSTGRVDSSIASSLHLNEIGQQK